MNKMSPLRWLSITLFILAFFCKEIPAIASQFSAEMIMRHGKDIVLSGNIYVKDQRYRMEVVKEGKLGILIVDNSSGITLTLNPEGEVYFEESARFAKTYEEAMVLNFFICPPDVSKFCDVKNLGTEMINRYVCDKYLLTKDSKEIAYQWVSKELGFPIKWRDSEKEEDVIELMKIKENPIPDSIFQIPNYYKKLNRPYATFDSRRNWAANEVKYGIKDCMRGYKFDSEENIFECEFEGQKYSVWKFGKEGKYSLSFLKNNELVDSIAFINNGYRIECKFVNEQPQCEVQ